MSGTDFQDEPLREPRQVRAEHTAEGVRGPWGVGITDAQLRTHVAHILSERGGLETIRSSERHAAACGCVAPVAGYCSACGDSACSQCYGRCNCCSRPLCPRHSVFPAGVAAGVRHCSACDAQQRRSKFWRRLAAVLLPGLRRGGERGQHETR